jgi:hypothetical protein
MPPRKMKKIEYRNVTPGETIFLTIERTERNPEGRPIMVSPSKSVFLNEDDIEFYKNDARFVRGRIRPAGVDTVLAGDIQVRDDMSDLEIQVFIEKMETAKVLGNKLKPLASITTVSGILDQCKKQDKPYSLIETCLRKLNTLSKGMSIEIKNAKKDEKKED